MSAPENPYLRRPASPSTDGGSANADDNWWPELAVGAVVCALLIPSWTALTASVYAPSQRGFLLIAGLLLIATPLFRRAPAIGLAFVWVIGVLHLMVPQPPFVAELMVALVAFGCARYGSQALLWVSAASIGASILPAALLWVMWLRQGWIPLYRRIPWSEGVAPVAVFLLGLVAWVLFLLVPWLIGFSLRSRGESVAAQRDRGVAEAAQQHALAEATHAREVAELKESQTQLARDVHDVVGHSLAVILAQAESAQFVPESDTAKQRQILADIATSARQSLQDVRNVLSRTADGAATAPAAEVRPGGLDRLIDGLRVAGNDVRSTVVGMPQPLPPELDAVGYRVMQEMLTNALKHGKRGEPVWVEQHWSDPDREGDDLRLEVRNLVAETEETQPISAGLGLKGMRDRLSSVGGHLDVRRRNEPDVGLTHTVTAWLPRRVR